MATSIDQKNHIRTALRVPPELHAQIHEAAAASGRSFNAEIIHRLEQSFTRHHVSHVQAGASPEHYGGESARAKPGDSASLSDASLANRQKQIVDEINPLLDEHKSLIELVRVLDAELDSISQEADIVTRTRMDYELKSLMAKERILRKRVDASVYELEQLMKRGPLIQAAEELMRDYREKMSNDPRAASFGGKPSAGQE